MEGMVAKWYATNTGKSLDEFAKLALRVSHEIPPNAAVLEVALGPGYFCIELAKLGSYAITGLDISHTFVELANKKAAEAGVQVDFRQGNASTLPFADNSFDFLLCRAAFKNFAEPVRALAQMYRVLKPGGRGIIIDLRKDASLESIDHHVNTMALGAVNRAMTKLTFRLMLLKSAYTRPQFEFMLAQAGVSKFEIREADIGYEISMMK
jgi:ubiquinone/menaquinone biosynthesis C-methylase UbiE